VGYPIKLLDLQHDSKGSSDYDPEIFPGLIFRMQKPKVVLLIFASGKIVLTGAKKRQDIYEAYEKIKSLLQKHRKDQQ